jgi:hypothetical protein
MSFVNASYVPESGRLLELLKRSATDPKRTFGFDQFFRENRLQKLIALTCLLGLMTGCATSRITPKTDLHREESSFPESSGILTRGVGDQIAGQAVRTVTSALQITKQVVFGKNEGEASIATCGIAAPAGTWAFGGIYEKGQDKAECFGPVLMTASNADGSTNWNCGYDIERFICHGKDDQYFVVTPFGKWTLKQDASTLSVVSVNVTSGSQSLRDLTYSGRNGSSAVFTYREFRGDPSAPELEDESEHEIGNATILDIHGFRISVISATDSHITYELLRISAENSALEE